MNNELSFWERDYYFDQVDFTIVGAGLVGLTTAIFLKKKHPKAKIILLERDFPGKGASTKNAGFACFGSASEILQDLENMSLDQVSDLVRLRWQGLELLRQLVRPDKMDYKPHGSREVFGNKATHSFEACSDHLKSLNKLINESIGLANVFSVKNNDTFPLLYDRCLENTYEAQLNPMLMIAELSAMVQELGISIIYNTAVQNIRAEDKKIDLQYAGEVAYKNLIVCTNGFASALLPELDDLKTVRNQVLMTEEIENLSWKGTYHMDRGYIYFRNYKNRILLGGARNLDLDGETTDQIGPNLRIIAHLKDFLYNKLQVSPKVKISDQWSGILGVGSQKTPIVRELNYNIFVGVRMGGMGVAIGSAIGQELATLID